MERLYGLRDKSMIKLFSIILISLLGLTNCKDCKKQKDYPSISHLLKTKKVDEILDFHMLSNRTYLIEGLKDTFLIKSKIISSKNIDVVSSNARLKYQNDYYIIEPIKPNYECVVMIYYTKDTSYFLGKKVFDVRDSI